MKALFEAIPFQILEQKEITENGKRRLHVRGILHRADERNLNNRIYPKAIIERETRKMSDRIGKGETIFMQADHPTDGTSRIGDTTAILRSVSFNPKTNEVMGEADIISTHKGDDLAQIIQAGGGIGISARGFGSTKPGEWAGVKGEVVQEDYQLVTYDFVVGQSTRGAVVTNFMEQARMLSGLEGEKDMDLKTLDFEQLKAARPDLITSIEESVKKTAKEETEKSINAMLAEKTKEIEDKLRLEAKSKKAADAEDEADGGADDDEENADGTKKKAKKEQEEKVGQLRVEAKKFGYALVKENEVSGTKVENEITKLRSQLTEAVAGLQKLEAGQKSLTEQAEQVEVHKYIMEKTSDEKKFKNALIERLIKNCKSKKEVDEKLPVERADIEKLLNEHAGAGRGNGVTEKSEEKGDDTQEKTYKTKNGLVLTEQQLRTRTMSGIKTELAE